MTGWRLWALIAGGLVAILGAWIWGEAGMPMVFVLGVLMMITAVLEPIYGQANGKPAGAAWHRTDERFVDPETGRLVTVWFDPDTGERRYVDEPVTPPPT